MLALAGALVALASIAPAALARGHGSRVAPVLHGHALPAHAGRPRGSSRRHARAHRRLSATPRKLRRLKARAGRRYARRHAPAGRAPQPPARRRPFVFGALNWRGLTETSSTPPDTTGAIGPDNYVEMTNDGLAVYARADRAEVSSAALDSFLGVPGDDVTDPQIIWDEGSGRWYFVGLDFTTGGEQLLFGFTQTGDPSDLDTGWCRYSIATPGFVDDYPKLGDDDGHLVIGANRFEGDTFRTAVIYAIDKPAAGPTCPATPSFARFGSSASPLAQSNGDPAFTPVPANTTDAASAGYVVAADYPGSGPGTHLDVWHVGGTPGSQTLTHDGAAAVPSFDVPANAPQPGSGEVLDTSDTRLTQAVARTDPGAGQEALWTQHTVAGAGGRSEVRWYELIPSQLAVRQRGNVGESAEFAFNGAISPTGDGESAVLVYNASGSATPPRIAARSHPHGVPLGQMGAAATIVSSDGPLDDGSCFFPDPCRWGDYAAAVPDPLNASLVWGSSEYALGGLWTSRNFALDPGGLGPTARFDPSAAAIDSGQSVTFDASSSSGSSGIALSRYDWDLDGDGSFETSTAADPRISRGYPTPATVTVRLRVTDAAGDQSVAARTITVRNRPPVASLTPSASSIPVGQSVFLDGRGSSDPDGRVARYQWDLDGDGTFETDTGATATTATPTFARPAVVPLRLRVTDDLGATADAASPLAVVALPPPPPTKECRAARASVKKLAASVRKLKRQTKRAHGAHRRRLARKLHVARRKLSRARVRVHTLC